jgi:phosphotransferase family enzyme
MSMVIPKAAPAVAWTGLEWPADALEWIESHVGPTGPLTWRKRRRPWSLVGSVETADGVAWFKEVSPELASEPALTQALARRVPHAVPEVIAADGTRLLTRDAGPHLGRFIRHGRKAPTAVLEDTVARYAELEISLAPIASDFPAFDARPETLVRSFGDVVVPLVESLGDTIPLSLVHVDLFKKNVCVRGGDIVFLDWAFPAYGHPFCGIHMILRTLVRDFGARPGGREVLRVRDTYLEPWTSYAPIRELRRIFAAANPLGALCRVMRLQLLLESVPAEFRGAYADGTDKWLEIFQSSLKARDQLVA